MANAHQPPTDPVALGSLPSSLLAAFIADMQMPTRREFNSFGCSHAHQTSKSA